MATLPRRRASYKRAWAAPIDGMDKSKGQYNNVALWDFLRALPKMCRHPGGAAASSAAERHLAAEVVACRELVWFSYGRAHLASTAAERRLVSGTFRRAWADFVVNHDSAGEDSWLIDPNAKAWENYFVVSLLICPDQRLNDAAIIEIMHSPHMRVRAARCPLVTDWGHSPPLCDRWPGHQKTLIAGGWGCASKTTSGGAAANPTSSSCCAPCCASRSSSCAWAGSPRTRCCGTAACCPSCCCCT